MGPPPYYKGQPIFSCGLGRTIDFIRELHADVSLPNITMDGIAEPTVSQVDVMVYQKLVEGAASSPKI